jgi:hypothetical protein
MGQIPSTRQGISLRTRNAHSLRSVTCRPLECTTSRLADRSFLSASLCRHRARTISSSRFTEMAGVWSLRIPLSWFPADFPAWPLSNHTPFRLSLPYRGEYGTDTPGFPANSQLHSPASPLGGATDPRLHRGFRNLRTVIVRQPSSPCRHGARTISSSPCFKRELCVWPLRIPSSQ